MTVKPKLEESVAVHLRHGLPELRPVHSIFTEPLRKDTKLRRCAGRGHASAPQGAAVHPNASHSTSRRTAPLRPSY